MADGLHGRAVLNKLVAMDQHQPDIEPVSQAEPSGLLQWWQRNSKWVTAVVVVIAAAWLARTWYLSSVRSANDQTWDHYARATSPDRMLATADEARQAGLEGAANLAVLGGADLLLQSLTNKMAGSDEPLSAETRKQMINDATRQYEQIINDPRADQIFKLGAMLGLASLAEDSHDWQAARQYYERIQQEADSLYPAHHVQATRRLAELDRLARPTVFGPEPTPKPSALPVDDATSSGDDPGPPDPVDTTVAGDTPVSEDTVVPGDAGDTDGP